MLEIALKPLTGGILIAVAVSIMLLMNGRVTGISGIVKGLLKPQKGDRSWRVAFFMGLVFGGMLISRIIPNVFENTSERSLPVIAFAGLLVGFGTAMANGCTSGHGVCGISRMSIRSMIATVTFIALGAVAVFIMERIMA